MNMEMTGQQPKIIGCPYCGKTTKHTHYMDEYGIDTKPEMACKAINYEHLTAKEIKEKYSLAQTDNGFRSKLLDELDALVDTIGISMELGNKRAHEIIYLLRP